MSPDLESIHFAPPALADRFVCAMWRQLERAPDAPPLTAHLHANPYACLSVLTRGRRAVPGRQEMPARVLAGPITRPVAVAVTGSLQSLSLVLHPWLLATHFGLDAPALVDRMVDASALDTLRPMADCLGECAGDPDGVEALWHRLDELTAGLRGGMPALAPETLRGAGVGAAAAALGLSERHYRRLFARHMGLSPRAWVRLRRLEDVMEGMVEHAAAPGHLGEVAARAGYADQAHMNRDVRGMVLQTPARLQHGLAHGFERSWTLQAAHVRFVQDSQERAAGSSPDEST